MATKSGRGDIATTGDSLKLRDLNSTANKKPVNVRADDNDTEVVLTTPKDSSITSMDDGLVGSDDEGKKIDELVGVKATQTFENKTFDLTENTLLGTLAEFDTALEDDDFAAINAEQTLYNKTLV